MLRRESINATISYLRLEMELSGIISESVYRRHFLGHKSAEIRDGTHWNKISECKKSRVFDRNGVSLLYNMLEIHHSGRERSVYRGHFLGHKSAEIRDGTQWNKVSERIQRALSGFVCWLLNVPATCECISGTDLLRQFYVLQH